MFDDNFRCLTFTLCTNLGVGQKSVHTRNLCYADALDLVKKHGFENEAKQWSEQYETYFEYGNHFYMIADVDFVEADWPDKRRPIIESWDPMLDDWNCGPY